MANYYVNATRGNDSYDGLAPDYDGTHGPWKTMAKVAASSFLPGDTIDGGNKIYQEFVTLTLSGSELGGYITFQNFTVDGTLSFNGGYTYYGSTYTDGYPWTNVSNEVWSKVCGKHLQAFFEDGVMHTPIVTASPAQAESISRGYWTIYGGTLYYRATDGGAPSTHVLWGSSKSNKSTLGMLIFLSSSWVHIKNVTVRRRVDDNLYSALVLNLCSNIIMQDCTAYHNGSGIRIKSCSDVTVSNANVYENFGFGLGMEGTGDNITIQGTFSENGRVKCYSGESTYDYFGDGDNIGIGYNGGTIGTITIHNSVIENAGPGPESSSTLGYGIFVGTVSPMSVEMLVIDSNIIDGSHASGVGLGEQINGFRISNNVILNHGFEWIGHGAVYIHTTGASFMGGLISNNVFYRQYWNNTLKINPLIASGTNIAIANNIFMDNGNSTTYYGDLLYTNPNISKMIETNNLYWRSAGAWGEGKVICDNAAYYDLDHIVGRSSGYWEYEATSSQNNVVANPLFVDPVNGDFRPDTGSPAIAVGTNINLSTDYRGNAWRTTPAIGAIEYYKIGGVISPKTIGGKHFKLS